jgi:hypothetical protein
MSADNEKVKQGPWSRPEPTAPGPMRNFGGYYRTADRNIKGHQLRGVPLETAEATAVAAVRMGYQVIDAQIDRGLDMARRLRHAADRAGVGDSREILTAAEQLLSKGALLGLEWLESAANRPGNPLTRLLTAEYKILGSLFGLNMPETPQEQPRRRTAAAATAGDSEQPPQQSPAPRRRVRIQRAPGSTGRAITVARFEAYTPLRAAFPYDLIFYAMTGPPTTDSWKATLTHDEKDGTTIRFEAPEPWAGRWRAAVNAPDGEQIGIVEIEI